MTNLERIPELACHLSIAGFSQDTVLLYTPAMRTSAIHQGCVHRHG